MDINSFLASIPAAAGFAAWVYAACSSRFRKCEDERIALSNRLVALEAIQAGDFPRWVRTADKIVVSVSPQFVALFGSSRGLSSAAFVGRRFADTGVFADGFIARLDEMDAALASGHQFAVAHGVQCTESLRLTIVKTVLATSSGTMFVACAVPEL